MIDNGNDYQPYSSVVSMPGPGILYIYCTLGQIAASTTIVDMSANIIDAEEVLIGTDTGIKAGHQLWVDTNDATPYIISEISNDYCTAQNLGYSQAYVNGQIGSLDNLTTFNKTQQIQYYMKFYNIEFPLQVF